MPEDTEPEKQESKVAEVIKEEKITESAAKDENITAKVEVNPIVAEEEK